MSAVRDRVYQTSDLSGAARREFLEDGVRGRAYLRTPEGESLVLTRTANLDLLSTLRDHFLSHLVLTSALTRPREERRGADFGEWAFMSNSTTMQSQSSKRKCLTHLSKRSVVATPKL